MFYTPTAGDKPRQKEVFVNSPMYSTLVTPRFPFGTVQGENLRVYSFGNDSEGFPWITDTENCG